MQSLNDAITGAVGDILGGAETGYQNYNKGLDERHKALADAALKAVASGDHKMALDLANQAQGLFNQRNNTNLQPLSFDTTETIGTPTLTAAMDATPAPTAGPGLVNPFSPSPNQAGPKLGMAPIAATPAASLPGALNYSPPNLASAATTPLEADPAMKLETVEHPADLDHLTDAQKARIAKFVGAPKPEWKSAGNALWRVKDDGEVETKELPNPFKMTVEDQFKALGIKGTQKLEAGAERDKARMALARFNKTAEGQMLAQRLSARTAGRPLDPANHIRALAQAAKLLAGPQDPTDFDGSNYKQKYDAAFESLVDQYPLPVAGGSPSGQAPLAGKGATFSSTIDPMVSRAAASQGIPENIFRNLVNTESSGNPQARGPLVKGQGQAMGLTQLMPGTAADLGVKDPFDPEQNLMGGARYLRQMYDRYHSWPLAVAAYNAGPGAVDKHGGIPPYAETQDYVRKVVGGGAAPTASRKPPKPAAKPAARPTATHPATQDLAHKYGLQDHLEGASAEDSF